MILNMSSISIYYTDPFPERLQTVLLLHGLGADHSSWQYQVEALSNNSFIRPIAIDLPGFGESNFVQGRWSADMVAEACVLLLNSLSVRKAHIIGISMGGVIAQKIACLYTSRVEKLILINTFASLKPQKFNEGIYLLRRFVVASLKGKDYQAGLVAKRLFPTVEQVYYRDEIIRQILQANPKVYNMALRELGLMDIRKEIKKISVPTLVITAENDTTVPVKNQIEMAKLIPGAHQVFIPNANHAVIVDQPEMVNKCILDFISV
jgi:3-oxoadipate enol-lactonase